MNPFTSSLSPLERSYLDFNDLGNARRLVSYAAGRLYWIEEEKGWVQFDGRRFTSIDGEAAARSLAIAVADGMLDEYLALKGATAADLEAVYGRSFTMEMATARALALWAWKEKSGDAAKANAMMTQVKGLRGGNSDGFIIHARPDDFDSDPLAYNCGNGLLRFVQDDAGVWSHRFEPGHHPAQMLRQLANWHYEEGAVAVHWAERMAVMMPDEVARTALQRIWGMTLTGLISDQAFYILQGKGGDGKSLSNAIIGQGHGDYFKSASPGTFLEGPAQSSSGPQSDIVRLAGDVRMVVCDEPKKGSVWNGERIKQVTGSKMTARGVHAKTEQTFTPRLKLIVECNPLPRPPSDDRGFRRRFKLYPFTVQFGLTPGVPDEPVDVVTRRLESEMPGLLNWLIEGAVDWLNTRDVPEPLLAARANSSYWSVNSPMADFLADCCEMGPDYEVGATELYSAFKAYRLEAGDKEDAIMKQTGFGRALTEMQIYSADSASKRTGKVRLGIRLKDRTGGDDGAGLADDGWAL